MNDDNISNIISLVLNLGVPLLLLGIAMFAGGVIERKHFARIHQREEQFLALPALTTKRWDVTRPVAEARLVMGSAVVSADYFRSFLASLRSIFGGRVRSFESVLDRGRREAILRMKESFPTAHVVINVRLETSTIGSSQSARKSPLGVVELVAYGTAIRYADAA